MMNGAQEHTGPITFTRKRTNMVSDYKLVMK